jgi:iron complex outermembrane recepter protein
MKGISSFKRTVICICALFLATPLAAQESSKAKDKDKDKADDKAIEEVVVTATYRKTNLMDTPMGIGAVTDELIKELGAQDMGEIFRMVSGLNMGGEGAGQRRYTIRGVTSQQSNSVRDTSGATVAVYLDGSSMTSALGPARQITGNLFDIERVEVLKGPQGTLFGEGAQGGAIRYIYKSPDPTQIDAAVSFGTSTMKQSEDRSFNVNGMVNVPLIADRLAARVSLFQSTRAGWIDRQSGCVEVLFAVPKCSSVIEDVNAWDTEGGRAALQYKADRWSIEGAYYWVSQKGDGTQYTPLDAPYVSNVRPFEGVPGDGWDDYEVARVTGEVDLGFATLTSITTDTSRDTFTFRELFDPLVRIIDNGGANTANNTGRCGLVVGAANCPMPADGANMSDYGWDGWTETSRFTTEMRLVSNGDSRFRWTAGLYYKDSSDWSWSGVLYKMAPGREVYAPIYFFDSPETSHETESSETAVFGEFSYHITDTLELTAGGRFSKLEQNFLIGVKGSPMKARTKAPGHHHPVSQLT